MILLLALAALTFIAGLSRLSYADARGRARRRAADEAALAAEREALRR